MPRVRRVHGQDRAELRERAQVCAQTERAVRPGAEDLVRKCEAPDAPREAQAPLGVLEPVYYNFSEGGGASPLGVDATSSTLPRSTPVASISARKMRSVSLDGSSSHTTSAIELLGS